MIMHGTLDKKLGRSLNLLYELWAAHVKLKGIRVYNAQLLQTDHARSVSQSTCHKMKAGAGQCDKLTMVKPS